MPVTYVTRVSRSIHIAKVPPQSKKYRAAGADVRRTYSGQDGLPKARRFMISSVIGARGRADRK
jgi:hypothetical protein